MQDTAASTDYVLQLEHLYAINMEREAQRAATVDRPQSIHPVSKTIQKPAGRFDAFKVLMGETITRHNVHQGTMAFMRHVMDECTHLANFTKPLDTELIVLPTATHDLYYPRDNVMSLAELWNGCETRYLNTDHVGGCLFYHPHFR